MHMGRKTEKEREGAGGGEGKGGRERERMCVQRKTYKTVPELSPEHAVLGSGDWCAGHCTATREA